MLNALLNALRAIGFIVVGFGPTVFAAYVFGDWLKSFDVAGRAMTTPDAVLAIFLPVMLLPVFLGSLAVAGQIFGGDAQ